MKLEDLVVLVTGGSSGLGAATVRRLHVAGACVVICDLDSVKGNELVAELGEGACFCRTDITNADDATLAMETAQREFGSLHGLINCAGIGIGENVLGENGPHRLEIFAGALQVNLVGTFNMIRLAAAVMAKNEPNAGGERGVIVNTASIVGYDGQIGQAAYAAANAGIIGMTLPIARELGCIGIRVMTIAPGPFFTPRLNSLPPAMLDALAKATPFPKRLGRPDEYAALVQHIVENQMLNGEIIRLDGAMRLAAT